MSRNKRVHRRYALEGIKAVVGKCEYDVVNISDQGILIRDDLGLITAGSRLIFYVIVTLLDKRVPVEIEGVVLRAFDGQLALNYMEPVQTWSILLGLLQRKEDLATPAID